MTDTTAGNRFLGMSLAGNTNGFNMVTFYWACLTGILLSTFVPQLQPYLLTEFLHVPEREQGVMSGNLSFWGEVVIIAMVGVWGNLSDKVGRRPIMAIGYLIMSLGIFMYPHADSYQSLMLARIAFAAGVAAYSVMIVTLIADYVTDKSRGKATGMLGFFNGVGALITVMVLLRLPAIFQDAGQSPLEAGHSTYGIIGVLTLVTAVLMWFGLSKKEAAHHEEHAGWLTQAREGITAARDPGIALAYLASFVARGNLAIVGTFFTLWLANHGTLVLGMSRADALAKAGGIIAITQSMALISAPFFGILTDRINRVSALNLTLLLAFLGYGGTIFVDNPFGMGMIACGILIGMSEVGCIITSSVLIAQQSPARIRGSVIGMFNLTGAIGIMVASKVGGSLFDSWREAAPFIMFGGFALLVLLWGLVVRKRVQTPPDAG
ncbi:MAG: MFS transporter [Halieaceae bacterium]